MMENHLAPGFDGFVIEMDRRYTRMIPPEGITV